MSMLYNSKSRYYYVLEGRKDMVEGNIPKYALECPSDNDTIKCYNVTSNDTTETISTCKDDDFHFTSRVTKHRYEPSSHKYIIYQFQVQNNVVYLLAQPIVLDIDYNTKLCSV